MPIYLRNFYFRELVKVKEDENKQIKKSQSQSKSNKANIPSNFRR